MRCGRAIALLAASLVLTACGGGDSSAPIAAQGAPDAALATAQADSKKASKVTWAPASVELTVLQGTSSGASVGLTVGEDIEDVSLFVVPELASMLDASLQERTRLAAGTHTVYLALDVARTVGIGSYEGTVHLRTGSRTVPSTLKVKISVAADSINPNVEQIASASSDRIVQLPSGQPMIADELVVVLERDTANPVARILDIAATSDAKIIGALPKLNMFQLRFPNAMRDDLPRLAQQLRGLPDVRSASRHFFASPLAIPNDPFASSTKPEGGGLMKTFRADGNNRHLEIIRAPLAWDLTTGDNDAAKGTKRIGLAIVDRDFDAGHEDLRPNLTRIPELLFTFSIGGPTVGGHGTSVAGAACAEGNNGYGVAGVAWHCALQLYDVLSAFPDLRKYPSLALRGMVEAARLAQKMQDAVDGKPRVVNVSWGLVDTNDVTAKPDPDRVEEANDVIAPAIEYSITNVDPEKQRVLWVIAAGNERREAQFQSPVSLVRRYPNQIVAVAAAEIPDGYELKPVDPDPLPRATTAVPLWKDSNRDQWVKVIDVAAPNPVTTTFPRVCAADKPTECYDARNADWLKFGQYTIDGVGTSLAAPQVAGLAALILSRDESMTPKQVKDCIVHAANRFGAPVAGQDFHLIDAPEAVKCAPPGIPPSVLVFNWTPRESPTSTTPKIVEGQSITFGVVSEGSDPKTYQWTKNGAPAPGFSTGAEYTTPAASMVDDGAKYRVTISNAYGSTTSDPPLILTVTPAPPPTEPRIGIAPASLDFGGQQLGTPSTPKSFTITNTGSAPLIISSVTPEGANAGDFAIANQTCTQAPLAPAGGCSVSVVFTPSALGARSALLSIADNAAGAPHSAGLAGTGLDGPPPPPTAQILATGPNITEHIALDGGYVYYFTNETAATPQRWTLHRVSINGGPIDDLATGTTYNYRIGPMAITPTRIAMIYYDQNGHTVLQVADKNSTARPLPFAPIGTDVAFAISGAIGENIYLLNTGIYCPGAFCRVNLDNPLDTGAVGSGRPYYNLIDAPFIYFFGDYDAGPVWRVNTVTNTQELVTGSVPLPQIKWFALDANNVYVSSLWINYSTVLGNPGLYRISKSNFTDTANLQTHQSYVSMVLAAVGGKVYFAEGVVGSFNVRSIPSTGGAVSDPLYNGTTFPYSTQTDGTALYWMDQGVAWPQYAIVKLPIQ